MNLVEFLFAFTTVFGVSGFWYGWTRFVYSLEEKPGKNQRIAETKKGHGLLAQLVRAPGS